MPSRKLTSHCPKCRSKNHLRAQHCNQCGSAISADRMPLDTDGRAKLYADIAHPINSTCREMIQNRVIEEFRAEIELAKQPNYVSKYDDFDIDYDDSKGSPAPERKTENRVDSAHGKQVSHTPRSGGAAQQTPAGNQGPVPAPKSAPAAVSPTPINSEDNFGAGIFPKP